MKSPFCIFAALALGAAISNAATLISHTFDGVANDTGPSFNGIGFGATANPNTGLMPFGSASNHRSTFITSSAVDVGAATSFTITWNFSGGTDLANLGGEGVFFGVVNNGASNNWYDNKGIGIVIDGGNRTSDWSVVEVNTGSSNNTAYALSTSRPSVAELEDGFSLSLTLYSDNTYAVATTGLTNNDTSTGSFGARVTYNELKSSLFAYGENAGGGAGLTSSGLVVDSATLTAVPEPSALLLSLLGFLILLRRRRC